MPFPSGVRVLRATSRIIARRVRPAGPERDDNVTSRPDRRFRATSAVARTEGFPLARKGVLRRLLPVKG